MVDFKKTDLKYSYDWDGLPYETFPKKITFRDSAFLNLNNGYEVLHFINSYMTLKNCSMLTTFQKIEKVLREDLPENKRSHNKIKLWLNENCFF